MEIIDFKGKKYPTVLIKTNFGERRISTEGLNDSLLNMDGSYVSERARIIDESIFYFVPEEYLSIDHDKLVKLISSEL